MRVVHVIASGARGGGSEHVRGLIVEQRALGLTPLAIVGDDGPLADMLRPHVERVVTMNLMRSRWDIGAPLRLLATINAMKPDIVHLHGTRAAFFAGMSLLRTPSVYTVHGLSYRKPTRGFSLRASEAAEAVACRRADWVITVSRADKDDLVARRFMPEHRVTHIPNAMDLTRFAAAPTHDEAKRALDIAPERFVIATVSRLVPQKALADAIEAIAKLRDVTFVVIGDGPERAELRARAAGQGVTAMFMGDRDDVPRLLAAADVFLLSSKWEGEPIALLEALAMGLPCVATNTDGAREILEDSGAGLLVPIGDVRALANALDQLRKEPEVRQGMAAVARDVVRHRGFKENAQRVVDVYRAVGA